MPIKKLVSDWRAAGIEEGDTLLLHSSLKRTLIKYARAGYKLTPDAILSSFIEALGPSGTLILPLFNFSFTNGLTFDIRHSPSHMGALTESGRTMTGSVRTGHPVYSFSAIGKHTDAFRGIDNQSGYGTDSPFAKLRELDGKIGILNLSDQNSMTFYHHVEEMNDVPYRHHKSFSGAYIDAHGVQTIKTYSIFVRNLEDGVLTHVDPMGERLWRAGIYQGFKHDEDCGLRLCKANNVFSFVSDAINRDEAYGNLYKTADS